MMKKLIALMLALVMVLGMVACGKGTAAEPETKEPAAEVPTDSEASAEIPTLTIGLTQHAMVEDFDTNHMTLMLEEKLGCNLEFTYFSGDSNEAYTQLSLMISAEEELPDILCFANGDLSIFNQYGDEGYFQDMTPFFTEENAPNFFAALEAVPEFDRDQVLKSAMSPSGKIYGMPLYNEISINGPASHVNINQKWLDTLNLETPTTVDELYNVLKAFKEKDPNGNGKADEIGSYSYIGWCADLAQFITNAYVYCNDNYFFNATDGKVWAPYNTDEYRQAMIFLNKLVNEGLMDPAGFTVPEGGADAEVTPYFTPADGVAITGLIGGHCQIVPEPNNEVFYEYVALAPLKAATDKGGYAAWNGSAFEVKSVVTKDCENMDLAYKFFNEVYSTEMFFTMNYGAEGSSWEYVTEGQDFMGYDAKVRVIDSKWNKLSNEIWQVLPAFVGSLENSAVLYEDDGSFTAHQMNMLKEQMAVYNSVSRPAEVVYNLTYNDEEAEVVADSSKLLKQYVKEARALFATGAMDPNDDGDWKEYCDALEGLGLSAWTDAAQSAYTRSKG